MPEQPGRLTTTFTHTGNSQSRIPFFTLTLWGDIGPRVVKGPFVFLALLLCLYLSKSNSLQFSESPEGWRVHLSWRVREPVVLIYSIVGTTCVFTAQAEHDLGDVWRARRRTTPKHWVSTSSAAEENQRVNVLFTALLSTPPCQEIAIWDFDAIKL